MVRIFAEARASKNQGCCKDGKRGRSQKEEEKEMINHLKCKSNVSESIQLF